MGPRADIDATDATGDFCQNRFGALLISGFVVFGSVSCFMLSSGPRLGGTMVCATVGTHAN